MNIKAKASRDVLEQELFKLECKAFGMIQDAVEHVLSGKRRAIPEYIIKAVAGIKQRRDALEWAFSPDSTGSSSLDLLHVCKKLLAATEETLADLGGCDHAVGICYCDLINLVRSATEVICREEARRANAERI